MSLPIPNLDDKTFEELAKEAVSRIPIYAPEWTDHNIHDPGITFIELFAWLAEIQIYRLNRVSDRSYRKFLKLMGFPKLKPARAAEVDVTFSLLNHNSTNVPKETLVSAKDPISGEDILFETEQDINVVSAKLGKIFTWSKKSGKFTDNFEANRNENVRYYAFSYDPDKDECDPKVGDKLYLGFDKSLTDEEITAVFYLFEEDFYKIGVYCKEKSDLSAFARLSWEYCTGGDWRDNTNWKRAEGINDGTKHLTISGKIRIKIESAMEQTVINEANCFWLRCRLEEAGYEIPPKIDTILLNTVSAIQRTDQKEKTFPGTGLPDLQLDLKDAAPILDKTLVVIVKEEINGVMQKILWSKIENFDTSKYDRILKDAHYGEIEDFDGSKPGDRHYTVDLVAGRVTFGNGINGKIPPAGENNIIVYYRSGGGVRGNVKPHTIKKVIGEPAEKVTVDNKKPATGGEEAETLDEAILRARKELKTITRAVTSQDYEHLAKNTPGLRVARAKAVPGYHPSQDNEVPGVVTVIVVPQSPYANPIPSEGFLKTVYRYLDKHRLLTTELFVIPPKYIEVSVEATVVIKPKSEPRRVKKDVEEELKKFIDPITGGVDRTGWPFGRSVYRSELYEIIDRVEGVDYVEVESLNLKKNGEGQAADADIHIPAHYLVYSGSHTIGAKEEREV
jgi:hypothetical protein